MPSQRIRGQEVQVAVNVNGDPALYLNDIRSFSLTPKFSKLEEQYLGETSKRYDEIFDGADFEMELHIEDRNVLNVFVQAIKERAQRRTPGTTINITANLQFPAGGATTVALQDCYFENMPLNFGSRSDYGTFKLSGSCTDISSY